MILIRDIAADASQKAANQVQPSEEQLSQIDQAAEDNVWHEKPSVNKEDLKSKFKRKKKEVSLALFPLPPCQRSLSLRTSPASPRLPPPKMPR